MAPRRLFILVRRELGEHGAFLRAPLWMVAAYLLFALIGLTLSEMRHGELIGLAATAAGQSGRVAGSLSLLLTAPLFALVSLAYLIVGFFYCLATLYEERRDRSVLFWKSLPVSDGETVLAKAITVTVAGPLLALAVASAGSLALLLIAGLWLLVHDAAALPALWAAGGLPRVLPLFLLPMLSMPLLALPTVGWLMLCSAAARARPFLWAVLLPIAAYLLLSWVGLLLGAELGAGWFRREILGRVLLGPFGTAAAAGDRLSFSAQDAGSAVFDDRAFAAAFLADWWRVAGAAETWAAAGIGALMLVAAAEIRRRRELAD